MRYVVVRGFYDLSDNQHDYNVGDIYPREGYTPSEERIETLLGDNPNEVVYIEIDENEELTVSELKEQLDELGIEYPKKAKKPELQTLLLAHSEK